MRLVAAALFASVLSSYAPVGVAFAGVSFTRVPLNPLIVDPPNSRLAAVAMPEGCDNAAVIIGAGPSGLAAALALSDIGLKSVVLDQRSGPRLEGGFGINLPPKALKALKALGITEQALLGVGTEICTQSYYLPDGRLVGSVDKTLGASISGGSVGQIAIHQGVLVQLLAAACRAKGEYITIYPQHMVTDYFKSTTGAMAVQALARWITPVKFAGAVIIAADGMNSMTRSRMEIMPKDPVRFHGITNYRGVAESFPAILDGKTMVLIGGLDAKFVIYPISKPDANGMQRINWVMELKEDDPNYDNPRLHLKMAIRRGNFNPGFVDLDDLIDTTEDVQVWPMMDIHPLHSWTDGGITLMGDAAHGMLPFGSGGVMAGLLDALALGEAFASEEALTPEEVLLAYQQKRYMTATLHQFKSAEKPAEYIVQEALATVGAGEPVPEEYGQRILEAIDKLQNTYPAMAGL